MFNILTRERLLLGYLNHEYSLYSYGLVLWVCDRGLDSSCQLLSLALIHFSWLFLLFYANFYSPVYKFYSIASSRFQKSSVFSRLPLILRTILLTSIQIGNRKTTSTQALMPISAWCQVMEQGGSRYSFVHKVVVTGLLCRSPSHSCCWPGEFENYSI